MTEDFLMRGVGLALLAYGVWFVARKPLGRWLHGLQRDDTAIVNLLRWTAQQPELRQRAVPGLTFVTPQGAFYCFCDISRSGVRASVFVGRGRSGRGRSDVNLAPVEPSRPAGTASSPTPALQFQV